MKLYLVQHGKSKSEEEDPQRGLSKEGMEETEKMASFLSSISLIASRIFCSPKLRACQTAEIFASQLHPAPLVEERDGLAPGEDPLIWKERLENETGDLMLVGHLPHLAGLVSLLLYGDSRREIVHFVNSGVLCLEKENDSWSIKWMTVPQLLK